MKKIQDNLHYFEYSLKHPEPIWDEQFYPFLESVVKKSEYKNILILEDYLLKFGNKITNKNIETLLDLLKKKGCEKSYFAFFLRTCDLSAAEVTNQDYYSLSERTDATKKALLIYRKNRGTPKTDKFSLQAYNDAQTAKRRSDAGEKKVIDLSGLPLAKDLADLKNKIAKISKNKGKFKIKDVNKKFGIKFKFSKKEKVPDCIFGIKDKVFILEAKHVNGQGGAQNSSISELVSLLELKEKNPKVSYIAFLDGCYTKYLTVSKPNKNGTKPEKQIYRIIMTLKNNPNNFFVNTAGFVRLISDLKK